ncbi:MAG TPA: oligopeptide/dipeptide ABC transporter ATP-binding protein, partial [Tissierellaceae bacterium]
PYTVGLMKCIPSIDTKVEKLYSIPGYIPHPSQFPNGCRFSNRCTKAMDICSNKQPDLMEIKEGHKVRCWLYM